MSEEITKLEQKYIVVKRNDVSLLNPEDQIIFNEYLKQIQVLRCKQSGKGITTHNNNEYLVLNLDDEIDIDWFIEYVEHIPIKGNEKVSDFAVALVNAILKVNK